MPRDSQSACIQWEYGIDPAEANPVSKQAVEGKSPTVHVHFGRFASTVSAWLGSTWAFAGAGLVIAAWLATGPIFHFSDRWAQVISTAITLLTFLMVLLIQNTQNRDSRAINLKLNELIRAMDSARNQMIDIERLTDHELDEMQAMYEKVKAAWSQRQSRSSLNPAEK
jgi:low affinity Fe/Cu permease